MIHETRATERETLPAVIRCTCFWHTVQSYYSYIAIDKHDNDEVARKHDTARHKFDTKRARERTRVHSPEIEPQHKQMIRKETECENEDERDDCDSDLLASLNLRTR